MYVYANMCKYISTLTPQAETRRKVLREHKARHALMLRNDRLEAEVSPSLFLSLSLSLSNTHTNTHTL